MRRVEKNEKCIGNNQTELQNGSIGEAIFWFGNTIGIFENATRKPSAITWQECEHWLGPYSSKVNLINMYTFWRKKKKKKNQKV